MYKYRYNNQIHFSSGFQEAREQVGFTPTEGINPIDHFIVRIWHWDKNEKDYSIEVLDAPGHQVFQEYDDALTCFKALETNYPEKAAEEIKLDLVQYHRGKVTTYYSKILFPPILARQP
jgi:hypothetical protein